VAQTEASRERVAQHFLQTAGYQSYYLVICERGRARAYRPRIRA
jgi:hypothetical protein